MYSRIQIAKIKNLIGLYQESVEELRIINSKYERYIPALKAHAEACLSLMRQHISQNLNGAAKDVCQEAVTNLIK